MKSPSSMTIDSTAAEPTTTTTTASENENENDVAIIVSTNSRKRSSAAISRRSSGMMVVIPPRPSSSASGGGDGDVALSQVVSNTQIEQSLSPPQVIDIGTDDFSIICLSLFNEMIPEELQKFCLKIVELCDTYTKNDGKMYFDLKEGGTFLQRIEKNKYVFKALI